MKYIFTYSIVLYNFIQIVSIVKMPNKALLEIVLFVLCYHYNMHYVGLRIKRLQNAAESDSIYIQSFIIMRR